MYFLNKEKALHAVLAYLKALKVIYKTFNYKHFINGKTNKQ